LYLGPGDARIKASGPDFGRSPAGKTTKSTLRPSEDRPEGRAFLTRIRPTPSGVRPRPRPWHRPGWIPPACAKEIWPNSKIIVVGPLGLLYLGPTKSVLRQAEGRPEGRAFPTRIRPKSCPEARFSARNGDRVLNSPMTSMHKLDKMRRQGAMRHCLPPRSTSFVQSAKLLCGVPRRCDCTSPWTNMCSAYSMLCNNACGPYIGLTNLNNLRDLDNPTNLTLSSYNPPGQLG
jgi:hypothetical protein